MTRCAGRRGAVVGGIIRDSPGTEVLRRGHSVQVMRNESIQVRGARVHNLKNIDFEIPHNQLTVVTGVSGSGKSSLAFDTIYAEGQRRYIESLSAYARQFLERIEKPEADEILGIAPGVAIRQKNSTRNPRSTVATATEVHDFLRLLYARVGRTYCSVCGGQVKKDSVDEVAERILEQPAGSRYYLLFSLSGAAAVPRQAGRGRTASDARSKADRGAKGGAGDPDLESLKTRLFELRKAGFLRLYQNGKVFEFSTPESLLDIDFSRSVYALVDRLALGDDAGLRQRLIDGVEICYRQGGEAVLEPASGGNGAPGERLRFSERFECKACHLAYEEPEPRLFSFNNPYGACPRCQGFGNTIDFDSDRVIPDQSRSLEEGAVEPWTKPRHRHFYNELKRTARTAGIRLDVPFHQLSRQEKEYVFGGGPRFRGVQGFFEYLERKKYKLHVRVFLSRYRGYTLCPECKGARLRTQALQVRIAEHDIGQICRMTIAGARAFFSDIQLSPMEAEIAGQVLEKIRQRLEFLYQVGLEYLTLDRLASTLSGGEAQRIQLATALGSRLVGALYVLDEPSIGLHPRDTSRLMRILAELRNLGNTIVVVEHDADLIRAADHVLDLGPGAGESGGHLVFAGTYPELKRNGSTLTGRYLKGELRIPVPEKRRPPSLRHKLKIVGASAHNLKDMDVDIPLGMMVAVTGVSGSGKSTLLHNVVYEGLQALQVARNAAQRPPPVVGRGRVAEALEEPTPVVRLNCRRIEGAHLVREVVLVDQSPIGRTPRSNPVTYIKAFDAIRELFAATPEATRRRYTSGYFSFNVAGGRCETCQGDGTVTVEMQFLANVELVCEECNGTRFKSGILDVRYRGKNIYEVLRMTVREARAFFAATPRVVNRLKVLQEVGLGYLRLGQSATTLSGGEAQRVKLAARLALRDSEDTLYIFDEPTTGLHFDDISKLLVAFRRLLEQSGSILIIEHNLEVIKTADWVIDLGPEGGDRGGYVVACGPPETIARCPRSYTGGFLNSVLRHRGDLAYAR